ncbi:TetR/AcrR family transcriptional regulator [Niveispirillum irakense]|uniref:TetR/AcrR family transcriptional regulator n=1 Tax=Niveispirillum irakense TaxID=34011 RepID=UPI0004117477|nr:TetR/AcrR family transcriptional regulator [Niveispirillum irakense]
MARQTRDELARATLYEARRLVAEQGLAALTARQLAQAVGCSIGTLYNLYPNLDTIRLHLNAELLDRLSVAVGAADEAAGGSGATPETRLLAQANAYLAFASTHLNLYLALIDNRPPVMDEPTPDWFLEKVARLRRGVERAIAPLIPDQDPERLERAATTIWAAVNGLCEGIVSGNLSRVSDTDPHLLMEELVATLAAGLRARG